MRPNAISYKIIGAAMKVHSALGPGLLESAYEKALAHELTNIGLQFRRQVQLPVEYGGVKLSPAYRIDFVVEDCVVVEIKAVEKILPVHRTQLLSYLKLAKLPLGVLINFKVPHLRDGICRRINAPEAEL
jgi:GxxExxY protein